MKLQQLRYVLEIVRRGNHLSAAAEALHTSQPGVSRQIQLLEAELGFDIFVRTRNRIIGLTEPGRQVYSTAKRVMSDISALQGLKEDIMSSGRGTLTVATTHTQARYVLPKVIPGFLEAYPEVRLVLKQGDPEGICSLVEAGEADLAVGPETNRKFANLVSLACFELPRSVIAKAGHPILDSDPLTLEALAAFPIITYDARYSGYWNVMKTFKNAHLEPNVILAGIDADVCKTYVGLGLGIGILTTITYDPVRDIGLEARPADHIFDSSKVMITLRANTYLRSFILDFIKRMAPDLAPNSGLDPFSWTPEQFA